MLFLILEFKDWNDGFSVSFASDILELGTDSGLNKAHLLKSGLGKCEGRGISWIWVSFVDVSGFGGVCGNISGSAVLEMYPLPNFGALKICYR